MIWTRSIQLQQREYPHWQNWLIKQPSSGGNTHETKYNDTAISRSRNMWSSCSGDRYRELGGKSGLTRKDRERIINHVLCT